MRADAHNRVIDKLLIIAFPAALFVYASTRPVTRLSPDMPRSFVDVPRHASAQERRGEERIAQAYWNCVATLIQWRYTYGSPLPGDPPDDFQIGALTGATPKAAQDSRIRYWRRLQRIWDTPQAWTTSREWSTLWLTDPLNHGIEGIRQYFRDLIKTG
jgi:hypothetical protein